LIFIKGTWLLLLQAGWLAWVTAVAQLLIFFFFFLCSRVSLFGAFHSV
jgi:hypothetical protein